MSLHVVRTRCKGCEVMGLTAYSGVGLLVLNNLRHQLLALMNHGLISRSTNQFEGLRLQFNGTGV